MKRGLYSASFRGWRPAALVLLLVVVVGASLLLAQNSSYDNSYPDRRKAVPEDRSRAAKEAEQSVALSADKIVSILRTESGLLLECKRILVRKAFEQGRLLEPGDLDDESVFQLVRDEANVRMLFTREIEDRYYIRAKPTREELQRNWLLGQIPSQGTGVPSQLGTSTSGTTPNPLRAAQSQEDSYWMRHEDDLQRTPPPDLGTPDFNSPQFATPSSGMPGCPTPGCMTPGNTGSPSMAPGQQSPRQTVPSTTPTYDPRRALLQAQLQSPNDPYSMGNTPGTSAIGGGQLAAIVAARMGTSGGGSLANLMPGDSGGLPKGGMSGLNVGGTGASASGGGLSSLLGGSSSISDLLGQSGGSGQFPQQASLGTRPNFLLAPSYPSSVYSSLNRDKQPSLWHHPNPYADVPSLYDLYSKYERSSPALERFGVEVFQNGTGNFDQLPMDLPAGPEYVLGPGDGLSIDMFGGVSQQLLRVVDREGRVSLPDVGGVQVSGKTLGDVQNMVQSALRSQYRDVRTDISLARLRSIRVYVVGDVQRPGAYDVSSLSTPLNAFYEAGGPTSAGSMRVLKHYRGKQLVESVDVYDLLLHGVRAGMERLEAGDTLLVPPIGREVTVEGMVRRPAVYELNGEKNLAEVLEIAGGVLPSGTLRHVDVERVEAHESRTMLRLDIPENNNEQSVNKALEDFQIQDGDRVQISPILPYADKTVYLDGHVFRPGKFAYRDGMKVTDLIKSYKDLLPEPYKQHAEIIRLRNPDSTPEVLAFNLEDALAGKDQNLLLRPFDTVRVFGRFDFEDPPVVTVTGEVRDPGDHVTNGAAYLRDAVFLAGNTTSDALLDDAQVFRKTEDGKLKVFSVNLSNALAGDPKDNILLASKDRIFIHKDLSKVDPPSVNVQGEVARPGKYPLGDGMTAADLVRFAGGLKRSAYTQEADLTRYTVEHSNRVIGDHETVQIAKALAGEPDTDVRLHDGDVLTVRQLSGWNDMGSTITVKGEVLHPGTYGIQEGERLSSILARAGGFRSDAYPYGAVFAREQVRQMEAKNRADLIQRVQSESASVTLIPEQDQDEKLAKQAAVEQFQTTLEALQNTPPAGRLVIHISANMKRWANTLADIPVRAGDTIYIPKKPSMVMVDGAVYNPTAVTHRSGKSAGWYLTQAGGPNQMANKKGIFVIRADGSVVAGSGGLFSGGVASAAMQPGDMVVVPEKIYSINNRFKNAVQSAQIVTALALAANVARTF
ncbi:MAG: SLBB domain-containing protein [Acidobacteriia bacterium]|nr:SLBB domain-containing protein [Terriglobia bacterium]